MKPKKTRWWKTALKAVVFLAVCLVTLAVLFAAALSFVGRRDWARVKADLLARGEKLSLTELHTPPIPEAQNFFGDPMWAELFDLVDVEVEEGGLKMMQKQIRLPEDERQLGGLNRPLTAEERTALRVAFPEMKVPDDARTATVIRDAFEAGRKADAAAQRRNAEFILEALLACEPVLSRLDALGERPGARLAVDSPEMLASSAAWSGYLMKYGQLLAARCWAELAVGKNAEAQRDAVAFLRLPETLANSPLFISLLVRIATKQLALDTVREGLEARVWSDRELAEIERILAGDNYPAAMAFALRGERGFGNQIFERIYLKKGASPAEEMWSAPGPGLYLQIFGPGEDAKRNTIFQNVIDVLDKAPAEGLNAGTFAVWERDLKELKGSAWNRFRYRITGMGFPNFTNVAGQAAILQDRIVQTRIVVALERYRLRHGTYPEALAALVPEFLHVVPVDVATLRLPRYTREPSGGFSLRSPGWDAREGGSDDIVWGE